MPKTATAPVGCVTEILHQFQGGIDDRHKQHLADSLTRFYRVLALTPVK
jgi:hypothetical protein